jgi:Transmembrane protein 33/Nucleoporin POM33
VANFCKPGRGPLLALVPVEQRAKVLSVVQPLVSRVEPNELRLYQFAAKMEFYAVFFYLIQLQLALVMGMYVFLQLRYLTSAMSRQVMDEFGAMADGLFHHPRVPSLVQIAYDWIRNFLAEQTRRQVQPTRPQ